MWLSGLTVLPNLHTAMKVKRCALLRQEVLRFASVSWGVFGPLFHCRAHLLRSERCIPWKTAMSALIASLRFPIPTKIDLN